MKYDLHMHSYFSACADKNNSIEHILQIAEKNKLDVISITDHNTCITHLMAMYKDYKHLFKGTIITGMECDICEDGMGLEALAYNFDPVKIFEWVNKTYGTLESRQTKLKDTLLKLLKENGLTIDHSTPYNPKTDYAHHYIYNAMINSRVNQQFFKKYNINNVTDFYRTSMSNKKFPLFVDKSKYTPNIQEVMNAVHKAGGIVVLAHPYDYQHVDAEYILKLATKYKVDGLEVYHPSADENATKYLLDFATKNNLIITGGSDYHGTERRGNIGITNVNQKNIKINILN